MRMAWRAFAGVLLALVSAATAAETPPQSIVLASTTSVENSGLLAAILPDFTKATNISVKVLAEGTGQALDTARRGDADLVLVHDRRQKPSSSTRGMGSTGAR